MTATLRKCECDAPIYPPVHHGSPRTSCRDCVAERRRDRDRLRSAQRWAERACIACGYARHHAGAATCSRCGCALFDGEPANAPRMAVPKPKPAVRLVVVSKREEPLGTGPWSGTVAWSTDSPVSLLTDDHPGPEPLGRLRAAVDLARDHRIDIGVWRPA